MGDKSPKSKNKSKKQGDAKQATAKASHDAKQAKPVPSGKGK